MIRNNQRDVSLLTEIESVPKRRFKTRVHPELLFAGLIFATAALSMAVTLVGYELGIAALTFDIIDLGTGMQVAVSAATTYTLLFFLIVRHSAITEDASVMAQKSVLAWISSVLILAWLLFLLKEGSIYSRAAVLCCLFSGLFTLPLIQYGLSRATSRMLKSGQIWFHQVALVGLTDVEELLKIEEELAGRGIFVAQKSLISLAPIDRSQYLPRCREVTLEIQAALLKSRLDGIWIVSPLSQERRFDELWSALSQIPLPIVMFPSKATQKILHYEQIKAGRYYGYEVQRAPLSRSERAIKRIMDIAVSSVAIILLSPLLAIASAAILIETGRPIFFKQDRKGFGGRPFKILKFRSMKVQENGAVIKQAEAVDPRVTPLGRVLRRTSIDELPQLINVLRGDMSIVGPRPHAIAHDNFYDRIIATYAYRHHVKPGITGWAQVNGFRGNTAEISQMEGRVDHDIWYINHWSPWLDIRIIAKTALEVLWHEAY